MSILSDIPKHARKVVQAANRRGEIDNETFTMAMARREVCKSMGLEEGALDEKDKRNAVKQAVQDALNSLGNEDEDDVEEEGADDEEAEEEEVEEPKPRSKTKSAPTSKTSTKSKPTSRKKSTPKTDPDDDDDDDDDEEVPEESDDDVHDEDPDDDEEEYVESEDEKPKRKRAPKATAPAKKAKVSRKSHKSEESEEEVIDSDVEEEEKSSAKPKPRSTSTPAESPAPSSPMSSVYDEPPAKRRESGGKKGNGPKEKKERKDSVDGTSPDEERVAELKKIVNACGVRKQWVKEFAECPTPRSQISHLLSLLSSLGMKGTPTLGKARSVKQKRELAAELDDVKEFEAVRGRPSDTGRTRRAAARRVNYAVDSDGSGDEEEAPKDSAAMAAVMDFLDDEDSDADSD